jgi:hypothetical protein
MVLWDKRATRASGCTLDQAHDLLPTVPVGPIVVICTQLSKVLKGQSSISRVYVHGSDHDGAQNSPRAQRMICQSHRRASPHLVHLQPRLERARIWHRRSFYRRAESGWLWR